MPNQTYCCDDLKEAMEEDMIFFDRERGWYIVIDDWIISFCPFCGSKLTVCPHCGARIEKKEEPGGQHD